MTDVVVLIGPILRLDFYSFQRQHCGWLWIWSDRVINGDFRANFLRRNYTGSQTIEYCRVPALVVSDVLGIERLPDSVPAESAVY